MIATPYGTLPVFDAHTHFFSKSFYAGLAKQAGLGDDPAAIADVTKRLGWDAAPDDPAEVGRRWAAEFERHGVDGAVSIHTLPGSLEDAAKGVLAATGRLSGYVMVNPLVNTAATIVTRAATEFGFRGVALFPAMFGFPVTGEAAYAVFEVANKLRLNVFVHCGVLKVGFRAKLGMPSPFDGSVSDPLALRRPCAEFPHANFVIPHLGSGMFRELLMLADMAPNVYADTSSVAGWAKYLEGAPAPARVLRQAVDVMGARRLLFATDSTFFPRGWRRDVLDEHLRLFAEANLTDEQAAQILGGNLPQLLANRGDG